MVDDVFFSADNCYQLLLVQTSLSQQSPVFPTSKNKRALFVGQLEQKYHTVNLDNKSTEIELTSVLYDCILIICAHLLLYF